MMDANPIITHGTYGVVVVYLIQKLKGASWFPWLEKGKAYASRIANVVAAIAVGVGIHHTWNPSVANGTLIITGLAWSSIAPQLMTCLAQYVTQEGSYQVLQGIQASQQILRYIEQNQLPQIPPVQKVTLETGPVVDAATGQKVGKS